MLTRLRGFGLIITALGLGCGSSVVEQASSESVSAAGTGGASASTSNSTATGTGGVAATTGEGGSGTGGAGGAVLADPDVRLSQGEPSCLVHGGVVTCHDQPAGIESSTPAPWVIEGIDDAREVAFALEHACVRRATGKVACWGESHHAQLGLAIPVGASTDVPIELPQVQVGRLATGHHAVCGIEPSGQAICWGGAYAGPLGDPSVSESQAPIDVLGAADATEIAIGLERACAVLVDGSVLCWTQNATPVVVPDVHDAVKVAVSAHLGSKLGACALRADGTVACWGNSTATPVAGLQGIVQLSAATFGSAICARTGDGRVFCLSGSAAPGAQLSVTPIEIHDAIDISAGYTGVCAVHADGSVACWGYDGGATSFPLP